MSVYVSAADVVTRSGTSYLVPRYGGRLAMPFNWDRRTNSIQRVVERIKVFRAATHFAQNENRCNLHNIETREAS